MKKIKVIFINSRMGTIEIQEIKPELIQYYALLNVSYIEAAYFLSKEKNLIYIDEEGAINGTEYGFKLTELVNDPETESIIPNKKVERIFYGNGLIIGSDDAGNDVDTNITLTWAYEHIQMGRIAPGD